MHALQFEVEKERFSAKVVHLLRQRLHTYRERLLESLRDELNDVGYDPQTCELPRVTTVTSAQGGNQMLFRWEERQPSLPDAPILLVNSDILELPPYEVVIYWQRKRPGFEHAPSRQRIEDALVIFLINITEWIKESAYELQCLTKIVTSDAERWVKLSNGIAHLKARQRQLPANGLGLGAADVCKLFGPMAAETRLDWQRRLAVEKDAWSIAYGGAIEIVTEWFLAGQQAGRMPRQRLAKALEAGEYMARTLHGMVLSLARESVRVAGESTVDGFVSWESLEITPHQ